MKISQKNEIMILKSLSVKVVTALLYPVMGFPAISLYRLVSCVLITGPSETKPILFCVAFEFFFTPSSYKF